MTSRDFCYWLQGYFEIAGKDLKSIGPGETQIIKNHLNLVFKHEIDPSMPDPTGEKQAIHDGLVTAEHHEAVKAEYDKKIEELSERIKNVAKQAAGPGPMRC